MTDPKVEMEIWLETFEREKRKLIEAGLSPEEADEQACLKVRRAIRQYGFRS